MIRNRFPRFRNLQNLHVIPTASNILVINKRTPSESESLPITALPNISNVNTEKNMFNQNKPKNKFNKGRKNKNKRKRKAKRFTTRQTVVQNSNYHWYNPDYLNQEVCPPPEKIEEAENISEAPVEEDFEEVEVASVDADGKQEILVGFRSTKIMYLNYRKKCFYKPKIYKLGSQRTFVNCLNVQDNCSGDVDIVSEAEYEIEYETDNLDQSESQDRNKIDEIKSLKNNQKKSHQLEKNQVLGNNDKDESVQRIYKTCIEDNDDICQGHSLIQSSLDTWKSHLIGLEYLIEIQNKSKGLSAKYYCVLCSEDLQIEEFPAVNVINHINGCKHIVRYLEKHFPTSGFKFAENSDYNVVALQKLCEEINRKLGYYLMCITNLDVYEKNDQRMKEIVQNAFHPSEKNLKLDKNTFQNAIVKSDVLKEVQDVVGSIIKKIEALEENTMISECKLTENVPVKLEKLSSQSSTGLKADSMKVTEKTSLHSESTSAVTKSKLKSSKSFVKYKGAYSSYLKLKYARAKFKGLKSFKALSCTAKGPSTESANSKEKKLIDSDSKLATKTEKAVCNLINSNADDKVLRNKEKVLQKPTVHSKHCRKRILGRENSRLRVAAKASSKDEFISGVLSKSNAKYVSVSESGNRGASKRIVSDKDLRYGETAVITSHKSSPLRKVTSIPVQKISRLDSKSSFTRYSKSPHRRIVCKKGGESSRHGIDVLMMRDSSSHWKAMIRSSRSPVKSACESSPHVLKSITRKHSRSPLRRSPIKRTVRGQSKSPVRKIRSPLRLVIRSPIRKYSRSPVRRHSRSPVRRHSRSPYRKRSKSPLRRKSRSPYWKHSRSPLRRKSRSPLRRHSRSPLRHRSRSPLRRRSRSPLRRRSRSPVRRRSRSPVRRRSRSPVRRHSKSPLRWHSRSPVRRHSRSPIKRHRSPIRKHSRSSIQSLSKSPIKEYRSIYKALSPDSIQDRIISKDRFSSSMYNYDEHVGRHNREYTKVRSSSKILHSAVSNTADKHKSHIFAPGSVRGISDLDPVSDEDESVYFDKQQHVEDAVASSSSKMMLAQLFKKFSIPDVNPGDPSLNKLMKFMEAHSAEIEELMGSQCVPKPGKVNTSKVDSNVQERSLFLQQYLLSNLAGSSQEPGLSSPAANMQPKFQQPPFLAENAHAVYGLAPNVVSHNLPQLNVPRFFPPNINVPPPEPFRQFPQPHQEFSPKSQVPPEVMFKDLKATVNKLFGANELTGKQEKNKPLVPGYVTEPDPEKWDLNHPDTPKFNAPSGPKFSGRIGPRFNAPISQKNVFHSQGKNINFSGAPESLIIRPEMPVMYNNNNPPRQFFGGGGIDRPQVQNVPVPPPDAKVSFCDVPRGSSKGNLFPVVHNAQVNSNFNSPSSHGGVSDVKVSLAQRLASVLVKVGMTDVPAPLLQEMLMKIGAFSSLPRQDISEAEIISILKRLGYLS